MYKLAALGALILALAAPASAGAQRARTHHALTPSCQQIVVFQQSRNYAMCDGKFWMRDPLTGQVVRVPFWKLQQPSYNPDLP